MQIYFFDVTVKVEHDGRAVESVVLKSARARQEHDARRIVLDHYLKRGFQVIRMTHVEERSPRRNDGH